ncbi:serine/threonine-protein phosphatase 1 regulatory subunit 10 isoform X1 [Takifugu rubripes]|uniref:serine/threonine-protein phosphatase 1 regulatory subunit 10 isoform X1 n=1 Tax=Takifugu rubripes TaxID=31033 RepID=UPI0005D2CC21|nr:serine/threonine-protein phosphatase 1 regulatory subunit 10 isoform X1 [Takifugu rubripes]XP_029701026.1 serine/threonine-protein phosphatase 1 regulatory subunit 10 isoform X1 [Takifugu rubripes]XP_029701027.1 serine/threonine-protein phosphatase 1 regulatory subunit 10 isoform X1 [Takifugu rubripes]XP_029701028.1 serine/threonine-protein phosphatase 1 regulatory subunit 10 isoform X1 [Takifugu rubripes]XP_029701029.1 serine/threonine-protein phosphatase 1 regulatory subunit 10 isoform X1 |eukprot:XP_011607661.1 PREDICTED: serine/threonine-protein phosphatase 1 regulatory subunit 10 isoform X1 [Takifugu rubripes]
MAGVLVDPREILKEVESLLGKDGEICSLEGVAKVFSLMKASTKMVSRCMYLNIMQQSKSQDVLDKFITIGGYRLLNSWLTHAKSTNNAPMLQLILLTLQNLPLRVEHLKQNNTAKLVKQLSKSADNEDLRNLAAELVDGWMAIIRSQSVSNNSPAGTSWFFLRSNEKKNKRDESKAPNVKEKNVEDEKKKGKPKAHAPSHAKIRSIGLEMDTPSPLPAKKIPAAPQLGDKYNIKPPVLKRPRSGPLENTPFEKKYKPLNTPSNSAKEIKVKIIPAQPMESTGFLDALNSAPVPGIKIKKKKPGTGNPKAGSPTSNKGSPFEGKAAYSSCSAKHSSPEAAASAIASEEHQEEEQPGTPVPSEDIEASDIAEKNNALSEPREEESLTKKGKKKKTVHWPEEEQLKNYFYFDLDETERVNVNKIKDFGEAAKRELMMDRQTFEMARRLSHDTMEERVPWTPPKPLTLTGSLVNPGVNSTEKHIQRDREMGILQEIFLSKESVPDSPHEPEPEPYEPMPPRLIPLDEDSSTLNDSYPEHMDTTPPQGAAMGQTESSKLPPVLAKLMDNLSTSSYRSPQTPNAVNNPVAPAVNVQELLSSIMGVSGNQSTEDLIKQPDFSDKIKQLLGSLQQTQNQGAPTPVNPGLLGHGPNMTAMNNLNMHMQMPMNGGFPPNNSPGGLRFNHPPPPHNNGPAFNTGGGPRMMGPPPGQGRGDNGNYWGDDSMRGGPPRGGHFHRGGRGRGAEPGFRGRGRGGPRGGHNNMNDMSKRPLCRHFMMKGSCRYENNCAFYHPGVNGPPLPPNHPANKQHSQHPQHGL